MGELYRQATPDAAAWVAKAETQFFPKSTCGCVPIHAPVLLRTPHCPPQSSLYSVVPMSPSPELEWVWECRSLTLPQPYWVERLRALSFSICPSWSQTLWNITTVWKDFSLQSSQSFDSWWLGKGASFPSISYFFAFSSSLLRVFLSPLPLCALKEWLPWAGPLEMCLSCRKKATSPAALESCDSQCDWQEELTIKEIPECVLK
jgi:hypothetical protein